MLAGRTIRPQQDKCNGQVKGGKSSPLVRFDTARVALSIVARYAVDPGRCDGSCDYTLDELDLTQVDCFRNEVVAVAVARFGSALEHMLVRASQ